MCLLAFHAGNCLSRGLSEHHSSPIPHSSSTLAPSAPPTESLSQQFSNASVASPITTAAHGTTSSSSPSPTPFSLGPPQDSNPQTGRPRSPSSLAQTISFPSLATRSPSKDPASQAAPVPVSIPASSSAQLFVSGNTKMQSPDTICRLLSEQFSRKRLLFNSPKNILTLFLPYDSSQLLQMTMARTRKLCMCFSST